MPFSPFTFRHSLFAFGSALFVFRRSIRASRGCLVFSTLIPIREDRCKSVAALLLFLLTAESWQPCLQSLQ